jgi:S-adenosylmethionine:diacylglycerol 3-amino-3-carboxypropyl transferase
MLNQALLDNVNVFVLLDKLKGLTDAQLNQVVAQVLNSYRENTSLLGYRTAINTDTFESRNILV